MRINGEAVDRRAEILKVAAMRFAEFGFEATSIRQIANDAHILSGSIYHHFDTKEEMLDEVIRNSVVNLRNNTIRISELDLDAEHKIVALIILTMNRLIQDQFAQAILYNERRFLRRNPRFSYVPDAKATIYNIWLAILEAGVGSGLFNPDLEVFLTITTITRMLNTSADWLRHGDENATPGGDAYSLDQVIDFSLDFVLRAIRDHARIDAPIPRQACEQLAGADD